MNDLLLYGIIAVVLISTSIIFYNTIISKKWRDKVPNESKSWKLGFLYYNPLDERVMLPKRTGLGMTFNFAKPISVIITVGLFVMITLFIISKI